MGWMQANYCGFPVFYHYFPLTFIFMALLGYIIPLQVSFKLITVLGTFLLPASVYLMFRILRYSFPVPVLGAIFSLAFLFNENNSMWGGNIPSTLAGEFSFSFSLAIFMVFLATVYQGIKENKWIVLNALLFFLMGFSHGYTLVFFIFISLFYILSSRPFLKNIWYLFKVGALGGVLLAFWLLPFIANIPYVTPFHIVWAFGSIWEIFPPILIPFFILTIFGLIAFIKERRTIFFGFIIMMAILLYFAGPRIGLVDIRFLTFTQLFLTIVGAVGIGTLSSKLKYSQLVPVILILVTFLWVNENSNYIKNWIDWNYSGFEQKESWPKVKEMFDYLKQTNDGGRVVYENAMAYESLGTQRIFESLKLFAGRDTLEGLYMQSSISGPVVFYIQSEISKDVSAPFWSYPVSPFNLKNGAQHLRNFAVTQFIVRSDKVKKAIKGMPEYRFQKKFGDCSVYKVMGSDPHYVVPAKYEPNLYTGENWKKDFYAWFKVPDIQDVPVVRGERDSSRFKFKTEDAVKLKREKIRETRYLISEEIGNESIEFSTSLVGHPHIIRVSYHPNWRVEGAERIYLTTPAFMLVYPEQKNVKLTFGKSKYNYIGEGISLFGWIFIGIYLLRRANLKSMLKR